MGSLEGLANTAKNNKVIFAGLTLLALYKSIDSILQPIRNQVLSDIILIVILISLIGGAINFAVQAFVPHLQFAKRSLNCNPYGYGLRQTWPKLLLSALFVCMFVLFALGPGRALWDHGRAVAMPSRYCLRVAAACRDCAVLLDIAGRPTGPTCLSLDSGGLAEGRLDRWKVYRAHGATAQCSQETVTKEFSREALDTCGAYLGP